MLCCKTFRRRRATREASAPLHCSAQYQHSHPCWNTTPPLRLTPTVSVFDLTHLAYVHVQAHDVAAINVGDKHHHVRTYAHDGLAGAKPYHGHIEKCRSAHDVAVVDVGAMHHDGDNASCTHAHDFRVVDVGAKHYHEPDNNVLYASDACEKHCHGLLHETLSYPLRWQQHRLKRKQGYFPNESSLQLLCKDGQLDKALVVLYGQCSPPSTSTYLSLLRACIERRALSHAKQVHAHLVQHHVELSGILGDYLIVTLAKCGAIDIAHLVSSTLPSLTVFSCTAMISAYVECGHMQEAFKLHQKMQEDGVEPNTFTYVSLLKACSTTQNLELGKSLHAEARKRGCLSDGYVGSTLVSMYGKCGAVVEAEELFANLSERSIVSWNAMLSAYVNSKQGQKALQLYRQMQHDKVVSDAHTLVYAFQACAVLLDKESEIPLDELSRRKVALEIGEALHGDSHKKGFTSDIFVATALLSVYAKCGAIIKAADVFKSLTHRDTISWNAMISANIHFCKAEKALQLYKQMQLEGMSPDQLSCVLSLQACGALVETEEGNGQSIKAMPLEIGQALHGDAYKKGFVSDLVVCNTLVSMYGKCGAVLEAEDVFNGMAHRDVVSWTAMLSAYLEHDHSERAFWLYREMQRACLDLDDIILVCMLQVCSESGNLDMCNQLHFDITAVEYDQISFIAATLIYAYGNCASMVDGQSVFDVFSKADVVPWNTCIAGYATEGDYVASLHLFENLSLQGIEPDELTFSSVLAACRHTGLVGVGLGYYEVLTRYYGMIPNLKHYASLFDLLTRAGDLQRVQSVLKRMPMQADLTIWLCVLGACHAHGNLDLAKQAFTQAVSLQPALAIPYILMANTYANAGLQECAAEVEKTRQQQGAWSLWMEHEEDASLLNLWE